MSKPYHSHKGPRRRPQIYEPDQIRAVMGQCESTATGRRDRLAIMILWSSGLRSLELCALKPDQIDRRVGAIQLRARRVIVPAAQRAELCRYLRAWEGDRAELSPDDGAPLLCSLRGEKLDTSYLRHMLAELGEAAGVACRVHPAGLRNTFLAALFRAKLPLEVIRQQAGHTDIASTAALGERIAPVAQHDAMADFSLE